MTKLRGKPIGAERQRAASASRGQAHPAPGAANPALLVPPLPQLSGLDLFVCALSFDLAPAAERAVTNWIRVRLRL